MTTSDLNPVENTLRDLLAMLAAHRTGAIARAHGWREPKPEEGAAMTKLLVSVTTELVASMRRGLAAAPSQAELDEVIEGIALGVIERIMGPRPTSEVVH